LLVTGELYASIQHESSGNEAVIGSKMDIGAYQEFGTDKIPPRPFMGPAAFVNKEKIERIMARGVVAGILGGNALLIDE
jgi:HK97 gp10 family phage protein